jgi:hypothetical protein
MMYVLHFDRMVEIRVIRYVCEQYGKLVPAYIDHISIMLDRVEDMLEREGPLDLNKIHDREALAFLYRLIALTKTASFTTSLSIEYQFYVCIGIRQLEAMLDSSSIPVTNKYGQR